MLPQNIRLLQPDGQSEVLTGLCKQFINNLSSSWVWVATAASSANSMSLKRTLLTYVLALRRAGLKGLPSDRGRR